ncbi:MAG: co-chaperone GroES [Myxococcales bacterium]|nr:co-chaperone GroES [Myxococcales bacterium]
MKVRPLHDRLIVRRLESESRSKGGIIIPDTAKEKPAEGLVVAVGSGKVLEDGATRPMAVGVGNKVLFSKYAGTDVKINGEDHIILREDDCLAILDS